MWTGGERSAGQHSPISPVLLLTHRAEYIVGRSTGYTEESSVTDREEWRAGSVPVPWAEIQFPAESRNGGGISPPLGQGPQQLICKFFAMRTLANCLLYWVLVKDQQPIPVLACRGVTPVT
ncbi:hypothetical protein J6590_033188 [Homalodisca vitripennis]|nr:hypothetical protein J6590_033188 [Homalodisca vitripennis]